jgi:hypothetical protein
MQHLLNLKQQNMNLCNVTILQSQTLCALKASKHLTIKPMDKNLGPAIMDTESYITQVLKEHLLTSNYKRLTNNEATLQMKNIKHDLKTLIKNNHNALSKAEQLYFHHSFQYQHRTPIFYGLPKYTKSQSHSDPLLAVPAASYPYSPSGLTSK